MDLTFRTTKTDTANSIIASKTLDDSSAWKEVRWNRSREVLSASWWNTESAAFAWDASSGRLTICRLWATQSDPYWKCHCLLYCLLCVLAALDLPLLILRYWTPSSFGNSNVQPFRISVCLEMCHLLNVQSLTLMINILFIDRTPARRWRTKRLEIHSIHSLRGIHTEQTYFNKSIASYWAWRCWLHFLLCHSTWLCSAALYSWTHLWETNHIFW